MLVEAGAIVGPVRLGRLLRKASTHQIYEGRHLRLGIDVMLRLIPGAIEGSSFPREARLAAELRHPTLVPVLDFGDSSGAHYLVTGRAQGKSLEQHLDEHEEPLPEHVVRIVLRRVGEVLGLLHQVGLVHGDLRPSSLIMDARGQLRMTDLSFACEREAPTLDSGSSDERSLYWPPESASPDSDWTCDSRSDLYALGAIAYQAIFRRMPHAPAAAAELLSGAGIAPPSFDGAQDCSPELLRIVERLIAVDPRQRIDSADELVAALPAEPEVSSPPPAPTREARTAAPAPDSELTAIVRFVQRRFGSRKTEQPEGSVVHSSLRERAIVWTLLLLLLAATGAALMTP